MRFALTDGRFLVDSPEVGYVQLPDGVYDILLDRLDRRITGSAMAGSDPGSSLYEIYRCLDCQR